jgi:hypothetical protein
MGKSPVLLPREEEVAWLGVERMLTKSPLLRWLFVMRSAIEFSVCQRPEPSDPTGFYRHLGADKAGIY